MSQGKVLRTSYDPARYLTTDPLGPSGRLANLAADKQWAKVRFARRWLAGIFASPPSIADISCGSAFLSRVLEYDRYVGVDHPELVSSLEPPSARATFLGHDFESAEGDLDLGEPVDAAISFETIEHLTRPGDFLVQIRRNLVPRGKLLLSTPNNPFGLPVRYPDHIKEYSVGEVMALVADAGFAVDALYAMGVPFGLLTAALRRRKVKIYRPSLDEERGLVSKASDRLALVRKVYCRIVPYRSVGIRVGDAGETILLTASKR